MATKQVTVEVPSEPKGDLVEDVTTLDEGTVFTHDEGYGVRLYDGAISFKKDAEYGGDIIIYSEDELSEVDGDMSDVSVRNDLRLKIVLERV